MIPCKRVTHGFLCKPRYRAEVPPHLRPVSMARGPTGDPAACLFLAHRERKGGVFWIVDCTRGDAPQVHEAPVSVHPESFVFYTRDDAVHILLTHGDQLFSMRFSYKTQTADPLRTIEHPGGHLVACTEDGGAVLAADPRSTYYNHGEGCAYSLEDDVLAARPLPSGAAVAVESMRIDSSRGLGAVRHNLHFASASEAVVGPGALACGPSHVVVPWRCRVHPHTEQYARTYGHELRTGAVRCAGWDETRMRLDGPPLAWDWLDGDGLCAATDTGLWVLFSDVERLGWWDLVVETVLFRVPILLLLAWIVLENQGD